MQELLSSRVYLGEVHFGKLVNLHAHGSIVDRELWNLVQRMVVARGRRSSSERLLARLGVLRCGSRGARLTVMTIPKQDHYPIYRCPSTSDCSRHVAISPVIAEEVVSAAVRQAVADVEGRASMAEAARESVKALEAAQEALDGALRSFAASRLGDEPAAVERLKELRAVRDGAQARVDEFAGASTTTTVRVDRDWDLLTREEQRALIRATVESAVVAPTGRGAERIAVRLVGQ